MTWLHQRAHTATSPLTMRTCFSPLKISMVGDFLGGPGVKNLPSNAWDPGSILGGGTKIPHATEKLSLCDATRESVHHN